MPDEQKTCMDCGETFAFSERDQQFWATQVGEGGRPWTPPKRCKNCRSKKKANFAAREQRG